MEFLTVGVFLRYRQDGLVFVLECGVVYSFDDRTEERMRDLRDNKTDHMRTPRGEIPGEDIRRVPELIGQFLHTFGHLRGDIRVSA